MTGPWMQTFSGVAFSLVEPDASMVRVIDIAQALSMQCRYNGHVREFYSTAEHSCLMALSIQMDDEIDDSIRPFLAMGALLHDAHEAYLGDTIHPLKEAGFLNPEVADALTEKVDTAICERVGIELEWLHHPEVKERDIKILNDERSTFLGAAPEDWNLPTDEKLFPGSMPLLACGSHVDHHAVPFRHPREIRTKWLEMFSMTLLHMNLPEHLRGDFVPYFAP